MRIVRRIFWCVMVALFIPFAIAAKMDSQAAGVPFFLAMVGWWFLGVPIARLIGTAMVNSVRCKHCGLEVPAVQQWQIGGYTDHRERHILMAKSPIDGARVGHFDCPQCSATILV